MTSDQIGGIARALLAAIGGYLVGQGLVDAATMTTITGAIATLAVAGWSLYTNRSAKIVPKV